MKKTIHVHQTEIRKQDPIGHPAIIVRTYKGSTHCNRVHVTGPAVLVHAEEPDSCGARVTLQTTSKVIGFGPDGTTVFE